MKTVSLLLVLAIAICLMGCEDPKLVTCQQEKEVFQGQADSLQQQLTEASATIETMKTENIEMQNKAMEGIQAIMQKEAEKSQKMKQTLAEKAQQVTDLEAKVATLQTQIAEHVCAVEAAKKVIEKAVDVIPAE